MATKSGELRETLMSVIEDVRSGKIDAVRAVAISRVAAQISSSIAAEVAAKEAKLCKEALGSMPLGEVN